MMPARGDSVPASERGVKWKLFFFPVPTRHLKSQAAPPPQVRVAAFCPFSKVLAYGAGKTFERATAAAIDNWIEQACGASCLGAKCTGCGACAQDALFDARRLLAASRLVYNSQKILQQASSGDNGGDDVYVIEGNDAGHDAILIRPRAGVVRVLPGGLSEAQTEVIDEVTHRPAQFSSFASSVVPCPQPSQLSNPAVSLPKTLIDVRIWCTAAVASMI